MLNAKQTELNTSAPSTYSSLYTFLHGLYEAQTTGTIGVIIGMIMMGIGGVMMKSLSSEPAATKITNQQHKITA
jgi:hypothetical protein